VGWCFQVFVTILVYGGFCFRDPSHFALNPMWLYIRDFKFQRCSFGPWHPCNDAWVLTLGGCKDYLTTPLFLVLFTNVVSMCSPPCATMGRSNWSGFNSVTWLFLHNLRLKNSSRPYMYYRKKIKNNSH